MLKVSFFVFVSVISRDLLKHKVWSSIMYFYYIL